MDLRAIKWSGIYTQTMVSGQVIYNNLELALMLKKKEERISFFTPFQAADSGITNIHVYPT
jgi:hypothetical protein